MVFVLEPIIEICRHILEYVLERPHVQGYSQEKASCPEETLEAVVEKWEMKLQLAVHSHSDEQESTPKYTEHNACRQSICLLVLCCIRMASARPDRIEGSCRAVEDTYNSTEGVADSCPVLQLCIF